MRVPELLGLDVRKAVIKARSNRLSVRLNGSGVVVGQQPEQGSVVAEGSVVSIELNPPGHALPPASKKDEETLQKGQSSVEGTVHNGTHDGLHARNSSFPSAVLAQAVSGGGL